MVAAATTAVLLRFASRNGAPRRIHLPSPKPAGRRRTLYPSNTPQNREGKKGEEEEEKRVIFPWYFLRDDENRPSKRELAPSVSSAFSFSFTQFSSSNPRIFSLVFKIMRSQGIMAFRCSNIPFYESSILSLHFPFSRLSLHSTTVINNVARFCFI